ncbi:hypothetical protein PFTANZ_00779 [Plasmodium falciparum Tanzania (2000708)]|uniref:Uncharacterized protein n=1 Tax=Plasmodium falciparum Tanzania (2000708) TaxID=1036725 RepID=A0A024WDQ3_PLAFA|nr:hypothetical protein PFTANZ_00779 [Plasmodium falciparum Tanzania (2000708)]
MCFVFICDYHLLEDYEKKEKRYSEDSRINNHKDISYKHNNNYKNKNSDRSRSRSVSSDIKRKEHIPDRGIEIKKYDRSSKYDDKYDRSSKYDDKYDRSSKYDDKYDRSSKYDGKYDRSSKYDDKYDRSNFFFFFWSIT